MPEAVSYGIRELALIIEWTSLPLVQPGGGGGECIAGKRNISNSINILYQSFGGLYVLLR